MRSLVVALLFCGVARADEPLTFKPEDLTRVNVSNAKKEAISDFITKYNDKQVTFKARITDVYEDTKLKVYYFNVIIDYKVERGGELDPLKQSTSIGTLPIYLYLDGSSKELREKVNKAKAKKQSVEVEIEGKAIIEETFYNGPGARKGVNMRIDKGTIKQ